MFKENPKCLNTNCSQIIQCSGGTTSTMMNHLKINNISIRKRNISHKTGTSYSKIKACRNNILNLIKPENLNEILEKCATKNELSFLAISKCEPIISFVRSRNLNLPKSTTTIKQCVMDFYKEKMAEV